jgi:hypothetical protein
MPDDTPIRNHRWRNYQLTPAETIFVPGWLKPQKMRSMLSNRLLIPIITYGIGALVQHNRKILVRI